MHRQETMVFISSMYLIFIQCFNKISIKITQIYHHQLACCCGSAACSLCCSACPSCANSTSTRIMYTVMLLLVMITACITLAPGLHDELKKVSFFFSQQCLPAILFSVCYSYIFSILPNLLTYSIFVYRPTTLLHFNNFQALQQNVCNFRHQ